MTSKYTPEWIRRFDEYAAKVGILSRAEIIEFFQKEIQEAEKRGAEKTLDYVCREFKQVAQGDPKEEGMFIIHEIELAQILEEARNLPPT